MHDFLERSRAWIGEHDRALAVGEFAAIAGKDGENMRVTVGCRKRKLF